MLLKVSITFNFNSSEKAASLITLVSRSRTTISSMLWLVSNLAIILWTHHTGCNISWDDPIIKSGREHHTTKTKFIWIYNLFKKLRMPFWSMHNKTCLQLLSILVSYKKNCFIVANLSNWSDILVHHIWYH